MKKIILLKSIVVIMLVMISGCPKTLLVNPAPTTKSPVLFCDKAILDECKGCSPYIERLRIKLNELDETKETDVKNCIDASTQDSIGIKGTALADINLKLNGCLESSKVLDKGTMRMIEDALKEVPVREEEYQAWLQCYKGLLGKKPVPVVVIMDQPNNDELVYCPETRKIRGSNSVDTERELRTLNRPLNIIAVSTHLQWQNEQQVIDWDPALIIIHASAFYEKTKAMDSNTKLLNFLDSLKKTNIKILVYTRGVPDEAPTDVTERWNRLLMKLSDPEVKKNAELFVMPKGHESCFTDPEVGVPFKQKIRDMLAL